jgi:hypothetical protein
VARIQFAAKFVANAAGKKRRADSPIVFGGQVQKMEDQTFASLVAKPLHDGANIRLVPIGRLAP